MMRQPPAYPIRHPVSQDAHGKVVQFQRRFSEQADLLRQGDTRLSVAVERQHFRHKLAWWMKRWRREGLVRHRVQCPACLAWDQVSEERLVTRSRSGWLGLSATITFVVQSSAQSPECRACGQPW